MLCGDCVFWETLIVWVWKLEAKSAWLVTECDNESKHYYSLFILLVAISHLFSGKYFVCFMYIHKNPPEGAHSSPNE